MKSFNTTTLSNLVAGQIAKRDLILFDFTASGDTQHGFWTGQGPLVYNGVTYVGAGRLMQINPIGGSADLSAVALTGTLSAVPNSDLTPDVLATIESYVWHQTPVVVSRAYIDMDSRSVISVERMFSGYFDKLEHQEQIGTGYTLVAYFESKARDHLRAGPRVRGDADQRRVLAADTGLIYVAVAGTQQIAWGQQTTAVAANPLAPRLPQ